MLTSIAPPSVTRDSKVGNGFLSPILPTMGSEGKPGHHSPFTSPLARSNLVPWAGQVMHLSLIVPWSRAVFPTKGNPKWLHLLETAYTVPSTSARSTLWLFTSTTFLPPASLTSCSVATFVHAACNFNSISVNWHIYGKVVITHDYLYADRLSGSTAGCSRGDKSFWGCEQHVSVCVKIQQFSSLRSWRCWCASLELDYDWANRPEIAGYEAIFFFVDFWTDFQDRQLRQSSVWISTIKF